MGATHSRLGDTQSSSKQTYRFIHVKSLIQQYNQYSGPTDPEVKFRNAAKHFATIIILVVTEATMVQWLPCEQTSHKTQMHRSYQIQRGEKRTDQSSKITQYWKSLSIQFFQCHVTPPKYQAPVQTCIFCTNKNFIFSLPIQCSNCFPF